LQNKSKLKAAQQITRAYTGNGEGIHKNPNKMRRIKLGLASSSLLIALLRWKPYPAAVAGDAAV
jgi:hypothetical protein